MSIASDYVYELPFYSHLSDAEVEMLKSNVVIRKAHKGDILYGCGESCLGMSHILSGKIRVYIVSDEGREITLYTLDTGDNCVMSASCVISQITFETVMTAEEDSEMLVLNSGAFAKLAESNIYVKEFMYELATERFSQVMWVMQDILFLGFDRRLARFLISEYERTGETQIKMTQEEIAKNVNSAREVVARMLKRFSKEGLITIDFGCIHLCDIAGLKKII